MSPHLTTTIYSRQLPVTMSDNAQLSKHRTVIYRTNSIIQTVPRTTNNAQIAMDNSTRLDEGSPLPLKKTVETSPTAAQRVFDIGELVEMILVNTYPGPWQLIYQHEQAKMMRFIINSQRVNTTAAL